VADLLNMSKRKLQLKLANKNARYKKLLDDIRLTKAKQFLNEKELSLNEIAFLLGYSEVSSFSRAFKRWTGIAPGQYKKNS
jgi:AraC-like DNA-binding protein